MIGPDNQFYIANYGLFRTDGQNCKLPRTDRKTADLVRFAASEGGCDWEVTAKTKQRAALRVAFEFGTVEILKDLGRDLREKRLALVRDATAFAGSGGDESIVFERLKRRADKVS